VGASRLRVNIKYPSLLMKEQPVLMSARDDSNKP